MRILALLLIVPLLLTGCGSSESDQQNADKSELMIYTSIYPLQYFAERIGGETVNVQSIVPPGSDGHTYEPTTKELIKMAEADLLIYNGEGFEGFIDKAKKSLNEQEVQFVNASSGIGSHEENEEHNAEKEKQEGAVHEEAHGHHGEEDPHVWLDPLLAIELAETIKDAMVDEKPGLENEFEKNYKQLKEELHALDKEFQKVVDGAKTRKFIVAHSAYGRWEESYGLEQVPVTGTSPSHEPTQKEVQEIIDFARSNKISHILLERNISSDIAKMIGKDIDAEVLYLSNLESLTEKQLNQNEDYLSIMRDNIKTLKTALQ
ncbi:metal ABC transporter solute-binding protein, Zn/Mn family [Pseudalkalibacillus decolorationis]|uniref:metal ABC transporter solute-binding protein, Zn/Mn family n=1 Tax=Pseudalkalibacillus decolorationis TaxID=163879 RepID=UPI00214873FE|nr:zinc ABC transporter substrate-binding protein [Pseudalkalibacillus decolorationis]